MKSSPRRPGFTLIELLVVIAIIAILIALLVPAVQKVRASAAKTQCINNLKQMALALHSYEVEYKAFPPSHTTSTTLTPPVVTNQKHHFATLILPFMDQTPLFQQMNFAKDYDKASNLPFITTQIPAFVCPAAPSPLSRGNILTTPSGVALAEPMGMLDYGSINQVFEDFYLLNGLAEPGLTNGALRASIPTPIAWITDGSSNTILLAEDAGQPLNFVLGVQQGPNAGLNEVGTPTQDYGWADSGFPFSINGADPGTGAIIPQTATAGNASCIINCNNSGEIYGFHPGGANVAMCDGSVHFLGTTITPFTLAALCTSAGGEAVTIED